MYLIDHVAELRFVNRLIYAIKRIYTHLLCRFIFQWAWLCLEPGQWLQLLFIIFVVGLCNLLPSSWSILPIIYICSAEVRLYLVSSSEFPFSGEQHWLCVLCKKSGQGILKQWRIFMYIGIYTVTLKTLENCICNLEVEGSNLYDFV